MGGEEKFFKLFHKMLAYFKKRRKKMWDQATKYSQKNAKKTTCPRPGENLLMNDHAQR